MKLRDGKASRDKKNVENGNSVIHSNGVGDKSVNKIKQEMELKNTPQLQGDYLNVCLLLFLYVLQGIPLGMAASIPMMLQNKNVSYKQQAMFSLVYWPFSMKLLWAPIVDAAYFQRFGRRKTWLIPVQYLIGFCMLLMSTKVNVLLDGETPKVLLLTIIFFSLNFLAATQDIAVDGWALTMLQKKNVGYASMCNSVGQTAGYFFGNVVLLAFSSAEFCNKYIRSTPQDVGIVSVAGFLFYCSIVFLISTSLLLVLKYEKEEKEVHNHGIVGTYLLLIKIAKLPAVRELVLILLTCRVGFAAADAVTSLKLIEAGVKKETLALMAVPLVPFQIILPVIISKFTTGPRPLDIYAKSIPFRLLLGFVFALLVYWTNHVRAPGVEEFPYYYYGTILIVYMFHQVALYCMFVSIMAFFAKVSDPVIGGTYMTLLNTISNLGGNWPATVMLWFVDPLSKKECSINGGNCIGAEQVKACMSAGGKCNTIIDGYYIESVVCISLGFIWLLWKRRSLNQLQQLKEAAWKVT